MANEVFDRAVQTLSAMSRDLADELSRLDGLGASATAVEHQIKVQEGVLAELQARLEQKQAQIAAAEASRKNIEAEAQASAKNIIVLARAEANRIINDARQKASKAVERLEA